MAKIDREFKNPVGLEAAKTKIAEILDNIQKDYGKFISEIKWNDDKTSADVKGKMFSGKFTVSEEKIHVQVELGLLASAMKGTIEENIAKEIEKIGDDSAKA